MPYTKERPHKDRSTTVCTCAMQGASNLMDPHLSQGDCLYKPLFYWTNFYIWTHQLHFVFWSFGKCDKYFTTQIYSLYLNYRKYETPTVQLCCRYEGEDRRSHCPRCVQAQNDSTIQWQKMGSCLSAVRWKTHLMASSVCLGQGGTLPVLLMNMVSVEYGFFCYVSPSINVAKGTICIKTPLNDWASPLALKQWCLAKNTWWKMSKLIIFVAQVKHWQLPSSCRL